MQALSHIYTPFFAILKLALPLIIIQLCQASLGLVDTLIAGQYHYRHLAGVGLGSNMWTPVFILFTGILYVLVPKFSAIAGRQLLAVKEKLDAGEEADTVKTIFQQGKQIALALSLFGFILLHILAWLSPMLIQDNQVATITRDYLHYVAFAMPGLVYMQLYRFTSEGHSQLKPIMLTGIILLIVNALLSFFLVNGIGPLQPMGGAGCGLATAISAYIALFTIRFSVIQAVPILSRPSESHKTGVSYSESRSQYSASFTLFKQGLPIGITLILQLLALTTLAFFAASLGVKEVAAHQILINIAMMIVMIPVALGSATTIRIAHFNAAQDLKNKQRTGLAAMLLAFTYGAMVALLLLSFGRYIIPLFSQDSMVVKIAVGLILYTAVFQLFDTIQMVAAGILRGVEEFVKPLMAILIAYWLIVIPLGYMIGVKGWWLSAPDIVNIWLILALGMSFAAGFLSFQSYRHLRSA